MWKERQPPEPLQYDKLEEDSTAVNADIANIDQREWTLSEDFTVFKDR